MLKLIICFFLVTGSLKAQYGLQNAFPSLPAFSLPLEMVHAGDGTNRLFVVQQRGRIYVFENTSSVNTRKVFLDLSDKVSQSGSETGLLGLAFHPDFKNNGSFYVNYTSSPAGQLQSFISRFQVSAANADSAIKSSEQVLLTLNQPFTNHNGGNLLFGLDGYLYAAFGDGGSSGDPQNNAQSRTTLLGKILRLDVNSASGGRNYAIPPTNPYAGNTQGFREEIYAYGLRNPWKMSVDPVTSKLWTGDVGQNIWEEINIVVRGGNYGWRTMEANNCYNPSSGCDTTGLIRPIWAYSHSNGDASITGGYVYRGTSLPALIGKYVYGDYISGRIWALTYDGINPTTNQLLLDSPYLVSSFGQDAERNLYVVSYQDGRNYRLTGPATSVSSPQFVIPTSVALDQNYPNPFNPRTTIRFQLPSPEFVSLRIFDVLGREITILVNEERAAGAFEAGWDASGLPSGVYFYRLQVGNFIETKRMMLAR